MKVKIEAIIDLGDDYIDSNCIDEVRWARRTVENSVSIRVGEDVCDDFPIAITYCGGFYD
jgi:hypothetical protein|tara:strand:+ start:111 stop:290 length:180 start_codon:yes stop_codon:yes gene_type:complete